MLYAARERGMRAWTLLSLALLSGCLGADHTFPDESADTTALKINAYTDIHSAEPHQAIIEISGEGNDGHARAFRGEVHIVLAKQETTSEGVTYQKVREWTVALTPPQFSSPTIPYYKQVFGADEFPEEGTYQAEATANIGGRVLQAQGLFAYVRTGAPLA